MQNLINSITTTNLNDVFAGIRTDERLPMAYSKSVEYLNQYDVECSYFKDLDFNKVSLIQPGDPIYAIAQCRVEPQVEAVKDYSQRFSNGEELRWAPVSVQFKKGAVLAFGNTRFGGKIKSSKPCGPFICVDPNNKLTYAEKVTILSDLSAFSNAKEIFHQEPDKMKDVAKQAADRWRIIKNTNRNSQSKITLRNRTVLAEWDAAPDKGKYRRYEWFARWMKEVKGGTQFTDEKVQSRIYNIAFGLTRTIESKITEFDDKEIKKRFDTVFSDSKWDVSANSFENITTRGSEWQFEHLWGTKDGKTGGNCINNLRNYILRTLYVNDKYDMFHRVSVVIRGDSGASSVLIKNKHIKTVIEMATKFNLRPARAKQGIPLMGRIFFPQMFRTSDNKVIDCDIAYDWIDGAFVEVTAEESSKIVHDKQCSTCKKVKPVSGFSVCNSKGIKDGLQPQCIACSREYQKAYSKKQKLSKESDTTNSNKSSSSQWDGTIFIGGE